ncbi:MAG: peptidoglycan DD-metalloendopeptidase family protein [Desulfitobacteriaceae bacterium]|nr:peptidoglycan DD-metalloendopeptidase family protein [Desulfitobacteriaceae bacterium]MDI6878295.1 peptidoglycan DD-metalloendopeptidase family protein [Desulfitobacteriaceae bacterium]MDI6914567.1 peptidoglycan DD-metalloendopeptidase family protein [Desulfitobacteriaceae bacterium]
MKRKIIPMVLAFSVFGLSGFPVHADELSDALGQQQTIQQQQSQAKGRLNQLKFTTDRLKAEVALLNTQVAAADTNLKAKQQAYSQAQMQVQAAEKELAQKEAELEKRRVALAKRLKGIYENGQVSYLELLFQSSDLTDFMTRLEYLGKLVVNDQNILAGIQEQKAQIATKKNELVAKRDQAAKLQVQAASAKTDLDRKKVQYQKALADNKAAEQDALDDIEKLEAASNALIDKIKKLSSKHGVIGSIKEWPLPGNYEISSPFGWRTHPITHKKSLHTGVDIPAPSDTPIHAAGDGVVIYTGYFGAYGNVVIIDHGGGYSTLYAHQSKVGVSENEQVKAGKIIGYVGSTGWSTGPHLHFEVRVNGNPTDPLAFFN